MSSITRRDLLGWGLALSVSSLLHAPAWGSESDALTPALSWERDHPTRVPWTVHLVAEVTKALPRLEPARDIHEFFPAYGRVDPGMKALMWAEFVVLLAFFESAWEPCARYHETGLGNDTVTHLPVYSEGLLQLSYQDMDVYPDLPFNWDKDKLLAPTDCHKTILDPLNNLTAGVEILATQIQTYGRIVLRKNYYWSTLQDPANGKHSRVERIMMIAAKWAGAVSSS